VLARVPTRHRWPAGWLWLAASLVACEADNPILASSAPPDSSLAGSSGSSGLGGSS
jgi:hypothetical protein